MVGMYPMMGMGSNGLGVAGGGGLGQGQLDPRMIAMLSLMGGGGGGGAMPMAGGPLSAPAGGPMSQFIGARPPVGGMTPGASGGSMAPVVGGGMPGPQLGAPTGIPQPGAGGVMDIASMLKTTAGLKALLDTLKGKQEGLPPGTPPAPPGAPADMTSPNYTQGFGATIAQGNPSQPDWSAQPGFLQQLMSMFSSGPKY